MLHFERQVMDSKNAKDPLYKHKKVRPPSSSESSSSSDSASSSSSFSSLSSSKKRMKCGKAKKINRKMSSSSDDERARKRKKYACHKKLEAKKNHLKRKLREAKAKKKALLPGEMKHHILSTKERISEKERGSEREREQRERNKNREREKEREKQRVRERGRMCSRSPKKIQSRSPTKISRGRDSKQKSPGDKHHMLPREKLICQIRRDRSPSNRKKEIRRHHGDSRERERRERERAEREVIRNKEREEALVRCQERQRERERLAREKLRRDKEKDYKGDRLLPRPAEREMAIAAARTSSRERSFERDTHRSHSHHNKSIREPLYDCGYADREYVSHDHRGEKEDRREHDREYVVLRLREIANSPSSAPHYTERVKGTEREVSPEEQNYEHGYLSRNYISPADSHRREPNWERELPRERNIDHAKLYSNDERSSAITREWVPHAENWHILKKGIQWGETWTGGAEPQEEKWNKEEGKFRSRLKHEWEESKIKHNALRDEHLSIQQHAARRWPQERRGRANEDRSVHQGQSTFHHGTPIQTHQMDYLHERPHESTMYRRQHLIPKPLLQQHISHPCTYHVRPHFPPKRQMTYINPNAMINASSQNTTKSLANTPQTQLTSVSSIVLFNQNQPLGLTNSTNILSSIIENKTKEMQENPTGSITTIVAKEMDHSKTQQISNKEIIRDDLSEISDDADEILNKNENEENWDSDSNGVPETFIKEENVFFNHINTDLDSAITNSELEKKFDDSVVHKLIENKEEPVKSSASIIEKNEKEISVTDDILDFEEISDGELEEDTTKIKCLDDALGVDWASLVEESKFRQNAIENPTAKQKWQTHRVILGIGVSLRYAGEDCAKKLIEDAKIKLRKEQQEEKNIEGKIKIKKDFAIIDNDLIDMKMFAADIKVESKEKIYEPLHALNTLACVQVAQRKQGNEQKNLIFNACGPNRRALSAREDLKLRRQLCRLPIKEVDFQHSVTNYLKDLALEMFQKNLIAVK